MAQVIHRKGKRYRLWDSFSDRYTTGEMTRKAMVAHLVAIGDQHPRAIEDRMARADEHGTSSLTSHGHPSPRSDKEWEGERCEFCSLFHHGFRASSDGESCQDCGEPESDKGHLPPCTEPPELDAGPTVAQRMAGWSHLWEVTFYHETATPFMDVLARRIPGDSRTWEWGIRHQDVLTQGTVAFPTPGQVALHVTSVIMNHHPDWELRALITVSP